MINLNTISSRIQNPFSHPSNSYKSSFTPSHHNLFNSYNTHLINPIISIKTTSNLLPNATITANEFYTPLIIEETLYDLLGISESGTLSDIKRAYKQMALKYHPDVSPPERADEYTMRFIMVQEAYETLSDPESRAMYDSSIKKGLRLAFSLNKGSRVEARSEERARWKESWQMQVAELKRMRVDHGGRMSWAARIREQKSDESCGHGSDPDE